MVLALAQKGAHLYRRMRISLLRGKRAWRPIGYGLEMIIDPQDPMDSAFYLGTYDPWLVCAIRQWVKPGDVCLDIGAHKGYVTLLLAKAVGPLGQVFAFEPDPRAFRVLERHRERNGFGNVSLFPYALGRENGICRLALSRQLGWSSQFPNQLARPTMVGEISVLKRNFDDLVESRKIQLGSKPLRFVKIDAEGAEPLVLAGMQRVLTRESPILWVEVNQGSLAAAGFCATDIATLLRSWGFTIYHPLYRRRWGFPSLVPKPLAGLGAPMPEVFDILARKEDGKVSSAGRLDPGPRETLFPAAQIKPRTAPSDSGGNA